MIPKLRSSSLFVRVMLLAVVGALLGDSADASIEIDVIADASVYSLTPNTNYNHGHLYVGHVGTDVARSYLKFQLPAFTPGTQITSATLRGLYLEPYSANNDYGSFSWYLAANDSWSETGVTWNNQPGTTGAQIATWTPSAGGITPWTYNWDITSAVNQEYVANDGFLSLVFRADNEVTGINWHYWSSLEHPMGFDPFKLEFTIEAVDGAVPEATSFLVWGGLALTACFAKTCRRRRED